MIKVIEDDRRLGVPRIFRRLDAIGLVRGGPVPGRIIRTEKQQHGIYFPLGAGRVGVKLAAPLPIRVAFDVLCRIRAFTLRLECTDIQILRYVPGNLTEGHPPSAWWACLAPGDARSGRSGHRRGGALAPFRARVHRLWLNSCCAKVDIRQLAIGAGGIYANDYDRIVVPGVPTRLYTAAVRDQGNYGVDGTHGYSGSWLELIQDNPVDLSANRPEAVYDIAYCPDDEYYYGANNNKAGGSASGTFDNSRIWPVPCR